MDAVAPAPLTVAGTISPKRPSSERHGLADLFPYYAGFSYEWAQSAIDSAHGRTVGDELVLDPWNGSGTTTLAAASLGFAAVGFDINPITLSIARLRAMSGAAIDVPQVEDLPQSVDGAEPEPLSHWLAPGTSRRIRQWAQLASTQEESTGALTLVALFRTVRSITGSFVGSNPTWVKRATHPQDLVDLPFDALDALILAEMEFLARRLASSPLIPCLPRILLGDAKAIDLPDDFVSTIVTSPPYLTRIDYAVTYARELAIMGVDVFAERALRSRIMGTTLIRPTGTTWLPTSRLAGNLLDQIAAHPSKASSGYYFKQVVQYLSDLEQSLREITRVGRPAASMVVVVQDSYYKEVHIPLAEIVTETATGLGWRTCDAKHFPVTRLLTKLNRSAQSYTKGAVNESVITFELET